MRHTKGGFSELAPALAEADDWVTSQVERRNPSDRLKKYRRHIERIAAAQEKGDDAFNEVTQELGQRVTVNAAVEASEWVDIQRAFHGRETAELSSRLQLCLKGHEEYTKERADSSAHNYQFELALGAHLLLYGVPDVSLTERGDLSFLWEGRICYVECKRPSSPERVKQRIEKAKRQLRERYTRSSLHSLGFIGLSLTVIANPDAKRPKFESWNELDSNLRGVAGSFIGEFRHDIFEPCDQRTVGAFIHFRLGAFVDEPDHPPHLARAIDVALATRDDLPLDDQSAIRLLSSRLEGE